jgi:hypothetical protein
MIHQWTNPDNVQSTLQASRVLCDCNGPGGPVRIRVTGPGPRHAAEVILDEQEFREYVDALLDHVNAMFLEGRKREALSKGGPGGAGA